MWKTRLQRSAFPSIAAPAPCSRGHELRGTNKLGMRNGPLQSPGPSWHPFGLEINRRQASGTVLADHRHQMWLGYSGLEAARWSVELYEDGYNRAGVTPEYGMVDHLGRGDLHRGHWRRGLSASEEVGLSSDFGRLIPWAKRGGTGFSRRKIFFEDAPSRGFVVCIVLQQRESWWRALTNRQGMRW